MPLPVVTEKTSLSGCPALWSVYLPGTTWTCSMMMLVVVSDVRWPSTAMRQRAPSRVKVNEAAGIAAWVLVAGVPPGMPGPKRNPTSCA